MCHTHRIREQGRALLVGTSFLVLCVLGGVRANAQCTSDSSASTWPTVRLNVVLSNQLFSVANRTDVVGALNLWIEALSCTTKLNFNSKVDVLATQDAIRARVSEKTVDILVLDNVEFLDLSDDGLVEGIGVSSYDGRPMAFPYLLLVNQEIDSLAQLRGQSSVFYMHTGSAASVAWAVSLLSENHYGHVDDFFASFESSTKATNCILPLFFGKIQACVVDSRDWETIKELNPQLGNKLKILAQSVPVLDGITAFPRTPMPYRERIIGSIFQMHKQPLGDQVLKALRSGPIIPYRPEYLDSTRQFWKRYERTLTAAELKAWKDTLQPGRPHEAHNSAGTQRPVSATAAKE